MSEKKTNEDKRRKENILIDIRDRKRAYAREEQPTDRDIYECHLCSTRWRRWRPKMYSTE